MTKFAKFTTVKIEVTDDKKVNEKSGEYALNGENVNIACVGEQKTDYARNYRHKQKEVGRIIRVDHAGEHGAIKIYQAQLFFARYFYQDLVPQLKEMLEHEKNHHQIFSAFLKSRQIRTCYALPIWAIGGYLLGIVTAMLGKNAISICTYAIESTVLRHLDWQLGFLKKVDSSAYRVVESIKMDEEEHRYFGEQTLKRTWLYYPIFYIVRLSTRFAIWLSTKL
ncbi:demethoxyubiquinone hydroxylase family protein [Aliikangiella maris]|uniref:Demethoxyubiquinone hydroxylase family protein n=2 Tax=Aliikangiella maris TaxID=3162458 RepID=A0ABV2BY03_9GAMM